MRSLFAWVGVLALAGVLSACGDGGDGGGAGSTAAVTNPSSITSRSVIPTTDPKCPGTGGVEIFYGIDDNGNGVLDVAERDGSEVICNGAAGAPAWERLAERASFLQMDMGTWDYTPINIHTAFNPAPSGSILGQQSMAGRVAIGLFDAYAKKPNLAWKGAIDATKNYLMTFMAWYVATPQPPADPTYNNSTVDNSLSNFSFLKRYKDTFGLDTGVGLTTVQWTTVKAALTKMLADYNAAEGTVDTTVVIDGVLNHIVTFRGVGSGLAPWDTARVLQVLVEYQAEMPTVFTAAEKTFAVNFQKKLMDSTGLGTIDFNATQAAGYHGVAYSLDALILAGDTTLQTALLAKLKEGLQSGGNIVDAGANDVSEDLQVTGYALSAFKRAGDTVQAAKTQAWLEAQVDGEGRIWFPQLGDIEFPSYAGETLTAILR